MQFPKKPNVKCSLLTESKSFNGKDDLENATLGLYVVSDATVSTFRLLISVSDAL